MELGWKAENPAASIQPFEERESQRFLDAEELSLFFRALAEEKNETIRDYILLSLLTGGPQSNLLEMQRSEIKRARALWEIPAEKSKRKQPMDVVLVPVVLELLGRRRKAIDCDPRWLFPGRYPKKSGDLSDPFGAWKGVLDRAGLNDLPIHGLRRTHGTWQAILGSSLPVIGKSLGHSPGSAKRAFSRMP